MNLLRRAPLRLVALVLLTLLVTLSGCSQAKDPAALGAHPEAVLVRFYNDATFVRACGGSLIGSNVVLTAAHCADKTTAAVIIAPAAGGQRATTSAIYTYDWTPDDPTMDPAMRNDLALLALRSPINIPRYAAIESTPCASCAVVHVGRGLDARGSFVVQSKALRVAADAPSQRPLAQFVAAPPAIADGGAFYRTSTTGQPLIVGMMSGKGQKSGGAYIAPLSDPVVQMWVRGIYKRVQPSTSANAKTASLHVLDEDPSPGDGDQSSSSSSSGADPVVPPSGDNDPGASSTSSTSSSGSDDPGVAAAPTPPASAEPVTPTSSASDGSAPSDSSQASSSSGGDKPDANGTQRDPSSDSPSDPAPSADDTYEDGTAPQGLRSWPGTIPGVAPLKTAVSNQVTTVQPTGNAVTVASPGDPAFANDPQVAQDYAGVANIYNSHGMPGTLIGDVPEDTVRGFMQDDKPLIVAACFGAAPMSGGSTIRRMVNEYGTDANAATTYGCSGYATGDFQCTGAWMNANGQAVPPAEQQRLGMSQQECSVNSLTRHPDGSVTVYWDQCKNGSSGSQ